MSAADKILLYVSTFLATVTGLTHLYMKYLLKSDDPFSVLNHPWQGHVLALHVLVGPLFVLALGWIGREHIIGGLRAPGRGGSGGKTNLILAAPMVVSGYLLQVITGPSPRRVMVVVHIVSGILFAVTFLAHMLRARAHRSRSRSAAVLVQPGGASRMNSSAPGARLRSSVSKSTR